ncbi:MAG: pyruvate ferredoxin oxidoreductase, partial [Methanothrix sp.]
GGEAGLVTDLKAAFYNSNITAPIIGFAAGLGGRDITVKDIRKIVDKAQVARKGVQSEFEFLNLRTEIL